MPRRRIVLSVVGGGSFYTPSFVGTMCRSPEVFAGAEVRLLDPDAGRTGLVRRFCELYTGAKKVPMTFVETPDPDRGLAGADFVIVTFRIGGLPALAADESIPPRFGYFGNETVGPGGLFMAVRTIPAVLDIARRMKRLCPGAWLLNYANPTNFIADALHRGGFRRSVGLCDGYICPPRDIGATLGIDYRRIETRHAGLNHCAWVTEARVGKRDLLKDMARVDDKEVRERFRHTRPEQKVPRALRWLEIFRTMGRYPAPAGHAEAYFFHDEFVARQRERMAVRGPWRGEHAKENWRRLKAQLKHFVEAEADEVARTHFGGHADLAIGVARAIAADTGEPFPVNIPHGGAVEGFAVDTVLELYAKVGRSGPKPLAVPRFPEAILAQQNHVAAFEKLAVTGILEKDRAKILQALCIHPFTRSIAAARTLFEAMWREERKFHGPYWGR